MNLEDLLIPVRYIDIFYAVIAQNGGVAEMSYKEEFKISREAFVELVQRLGEPPASQEKKSAAEKKEKNEPVMPAQESQNELNELTGTKNEIHFNENESELTRLTLKNEQSIKNESNPALINEFTEQHSLFGDETTENQLLDIGLPQVVIEDWKNSDKNLIRAILDFKDMPLKDVADRYGGRSAAANLANFMAKPDADLGTMRKSTAERLAAALEVPAEWILAVKKISKA